MTKNADDDSVCSRIAGMIAEFEQSRDPDSTEIGRQFAQLHRTMMENKDIFSSKEGIKPMNRFKNRYKDVLPYDKHRVVLQSNNESDYINASFIQDLYGNPRYIAAQGPIDESISDFFRMIFEFQITSIICTANDMEGGRFKFRRYWPNDDKPIQFGSYYVTDDESNDKYYSCEDYEIRPLIITQGEKQQYVLLYRFLHWLDHDIPNNDTPILELLLRVYRDRHSLPESPILVHCSAGCGRTGSIIAIDLCRLLINDEHLFLSKDYQSYPVYKIASHIRQFRIALIQTLKQYLFVHKMFVFIMRTNGIAFLYPVINNDENQTLHPSSSTKLSPPSSARRPSGPLQIILRNPPIGRRLLNDSDTPSPTTFPSEFFSSSEPPPIPPRPSRMHAINQHREDQSVHPGEIPIKPERNYIRSRNTKRKEATLLTNTRSDSLDILSNPSSRHRHYELSVDQGANSD